MADKVQRHFSLAAVPTAVCTAKQSKRRETELEKITDKKELDSSRGETRVNTDQRWRQMMESKT